MGGERRGSGPDTRFGDGAVGPALPTFDAPVRRAGACDPIVVVRHMLNFGFDPSDMRQDVRRGYADQVIDIILNGVRMQHDASAPHHANQDGNTL